VIVWHVQEAGTMKEKVLVFSHLPVMPDTCPNACLLWNFEEVRSHIVCMNSLPADLLHWLLCPWTCLLGCAVHT
jgi:hypothetical protein